MLVLAVACSLPVAAADEEGAVAIRRVRALDVSALADAGGLACGGGDTRLLEAHMAVRQLRESEGARAWHGVVRARHGSR